MVGVARKQHKRVGCELLLPLATFHYLPTVLLSGDYTFVSCSPCYLRNVFILTRPRPGLHRARPHYSPTMALGPLKAFWPFSLLFFSSLSSGCHSSSAFPLLPHSRFSFTFNLFAASVFYRYTVQRMLAHSMSLDRRIVLFIASNCHERRSVDDAFNRISCLKTPSPA